MPEHNTSKAPAHALISLLDDPDEFVYQRVKAQLLNADLSVIALLHHATH